MERLQHSCKSTESRLSLKSDRARNQETNELQASDWRENCSVDASPVTCHMTKQIQAHGTSETSWKKFLWSDETTIELFS